MAENHYKTLNVPTNADEDTIKDAYRHLVHLYHPDISTDPNASDRIIKINNAYTVLKDPIKRKEYDLANGFNQPKKQNTRPNHSYSNNTHTPKQNATVKRQKPIYDNSPLLGSDSFSFDAVFSAFGQAEHGKHTPSGYGKYDGITQYGQGYNPKDPTKGSDKLLNIFIDLNTAYRGGIYELTTNVPIRQKNGSILEETKSISIDIPKGIINGQTLCLSKLGNASPVGGENGDLFLKINITTPQNVYIKNGDVYQTINITPWEALLGTSIKVDTNADTVSVDIPPNSQPKQTIHFVGKGIPAKDANSKAGDLYFVINIVNPDIKHMDTKQKNAYKTLQKLCASLPIKR